MFEKLFERRFTIDRYRKAPLAEHRRRYLQHLAALGSTRWTLRQIALDQLRLLYLVDLKEGETVSVSRIEATAPEWPQARNYELGLRPPSTSESVKLSLARVIRWLRFLGWLDESTEPRHPHGSEVDIYEQWMRDQRGYTEQTIDGYLRSVQEFFIWLAGCGKPLASVRITDIDRAIKAKKSRKQYSRVTISDHASRLRSFFLFAEERGWCAPGLAAGIMPPRRYPDEKVRSTLSRDEIGRLLATAEGGKPIDTRDRAVLLLFIVYGLRAGEVRCLQLDDLDWHNETLRVRRPKTGRTDLYPLSRAVGQAVVRYLTEVRPHVPDRTVFLRLVAPIQPLGRGALGNMVRHRLNVAGITEGRRGSHALRHAAAQHLLDEGMSMKVIGDYLGHRNPRTTAMYAKLDLNALREVVVDFDLEGLS